MTRIRIARLGAIVAAVILLAAAPSTAFGHTLSAAYESRLPLVVYLAGAALAVGLSFAFLLLADVRAEPPRRSRCPSSSSWSGTFVPSARTRPTSVRSRRPPSASPSGPSAWSAGP